MNCQHGISLARRCIACENEELVNVIINEIDYSSIPVRMRGGLQRYFEHGIQPGSFLTAIIENDLVAAIETADDENIKLIPIYARFIATQAPRGSWGSTINRVLWQKCRREEQEEGK